MVAAVLLAAGMAAWQWSVDTQDGGQETSGISAFGGRVTDVYGSAIEIENRDSQERQTFIVTRDTRIVEEPEYRVISRDDLTHGMTANVVYQEPVQEALEIVVRVNE